MKLKTVAVLLGLLVVGVAQAQSVYSWVDAKGNRIYSDKPPAGSQLAPIKVNVALPAAASSVTPVAAVDAKAPTPTEAQKAAEQQNKVQRAADCEVARNNLRLLDDPKTQIVEKGQEGAASAPMDNMARIEARALAERQVQDFCRP